VGLQLEGCEGCWGVVQVNLKSQTSAGGPRLKTNATIKICPRFHTLCQIGVISANSLLHLQQWILETSKALSAILKPAFKF
jgi:hypothetical protein